MVLNTKMTIGCFLDCREYASEQMAHVVVSKEAYFLHITENLGPGQKSSGTDQISFDYR